MFMEKSWATVLQKEFEKEYMIHLQNFLNQEIQKGVQIYPKKDLIFNAFCQTAFEDVRVVIVGQDPYHGAGQAHGLSFSVPEGVAIPPSLKNIFEELIQDVKISQPTTGCLLPWARQGVFLLNATLTVQANLPRSHYGKGWEIFTDHVVELLAKKEKPIVFLLWGSSAHEKVERVFEKFPSSPHLVLKAAHPSFYSASRGFFGCKHFSLCNDFLEKRGYEKINWQIS